MARVITITSITTDKNGDNINVIGTEIGGTGSGEINMSWDTREIFDEFMADLEMNIDPVLLLGMAMMKAYRNNRPFDHAEYIGSFIDIDINKLNPSVNIKV